MAGVIESQSVNHIARAGPDPARASTWINLVDITSTADPHGGCRERQSRRGLTRRRLPASRPGSGGRRRSGGRLGSGTGRRCLTRGYAGGIDRAVLPHYDGGYFTLGHLVQDETFAGGRDAKDQSAGLGANDDVAVRIERQR